VTGNERREERRRKAAERQARWDALSPAEKLAELDARLGKDQGAMKQRVRLERGLGHA